MSKNTKQINQIRYGEIHLYYPIKFNTKLSFSALCDTIYKSNISFNEEYQQKIMDSLGFSLANKANIFQHNLSSCASNNISMTINIKDPETNKIYHPDSNYKPPYEINEDNIRIELSSSDSPITLNVVSTELESLQQRILRMENEFNTSAKIYGNAFTLNQKRIVLLPFKATLSNNKVVWIHAILFIFYNNMGILKLELPLINADTSPLKEYDIDSLIKSINNCWHIQDIKSDLKLSELVDYYLNAIKKHHKIDIIKYNDYIRNILFVDFDEIPKQINNISPDIQEELFRIISAPVPNSPYTSYAKDAREYIEKYSWGSHGVKYIIKTNGGVLSLIDKNFLDYYLTKFKNENNCSVLDDSDHMYICNMLATSMATNVEFAILIIMLKKLNESNDFYNKEQKKPDLYKIQKEYNQNILFINKLQSTCYGSVNEQTSQLEKMMFLYLQPDISNANQKALNSIIKNESQKKNTRFLNFISVGGLLLSLIFGLPSIYDALSILRKTTLCIVKNNIPYLTLENTSVLLWIILNLFMIIRLFFKKMGTTDL